MAALPRTDAHACRRGAGEQAGSAFIHMGSGHACTYIGTHLRLWHVKDVRGLVAGAPASTVDPALRRADPLNAGRAARAACARRRQALPAVPAPPAAMRPPAAPTRCTECHSRVRWLAGYILIGATRKLHQHGPGWSAAPRHTRSQLQLGGGPVDRGRHSGHAGPPHVGRRAPRRNGASREPGERARLRQRLVRAVDGRGGARGVQAGVDVGVRLADGRQVGRAHLAGSPASARCAR